MLRRVPVVATMIVLVAVGIMVRLGFWQLDRLHQKEALLARYAAARSMSADAPFPQSAAAVQNLLYRHSTVECLHVSEATSKAGHNASGASGLARTVTCDLAGGGKASVVLGWSTAPVTPNWRGGVVQGIIAPGPRLVADPPLAGLQANARPDPADVPNNHLSYAVQWFLFAATALVIYGLALRTRLLGG
jgi:surfeit locus 1 family protein